MQPMPDSRLHLAKQAVRLAALSVLLAPLFGCQTIASSNASGSQVRIIDASPDAPGLDIYQNTSVVAYNMGFGTITSYVPITPGIYTISADTAGSRQVFSSSKATFGANQQRTVLIGNVATSLETLVLLDQSSPAPSGEVSVRIIDQATRLGGVDVYLVPDGQKITAVNPLVTNVSFSTNTGYLNIPTGSYTLVLLPTGTVPTVTTVAAYTGADITYPAGSARTVILLDQILLNNPGFQVIIADDYDSPSSTS